MRIRYVLPLASLCLAVAGLSPALAQAYPGQDVSVNPIPAGGGVLLYPGGQYERRVPSLLQPGETAQTMGAIQLHMPVPAKARSRTTAVARTAPPHRKTQEAMAAPAKPAETPGFSTLPGLDMPPAQSQATPPPAAPPAPPKAKPVQPKIARAEPPPRTTEVPPAAEAPPIPGLSKRSMILFAPNATDPSQSALGAIKFLAADLNQAMTGPNSRIELKAFGGARGDKGSDAHRLSLKRALAIRQVLIDDGVPTERIDVQAAGGVDDSGPADRVDVYIKA